MKLLIFALIFALATPSFAKINSSRIEVLANEFFIKQQLNQRKRSSVTITNNHCNSNSPGTSPKACIDTVCSKMSKFNCDDTSEITEVAKACKGNVDGACVDTVCTKLGKFNCDDIDEVSEVAGMCKGTSSNKCVQITCDHLGKFNCDDLSEMKDVMSSVCLPNVDESCIENVCSKMGKFNCDDISELQAISVSCSI